ncbi:MAG: VWA domain-containing protein [Firmicutes bacterium]|nr:VWA domain-containing protein [Bacillota bacterium]
MRTRALLSVLIVLMLVFSTGCSTLLDGFASDSNQSAAEKKEKKKPKVKIPEELQHIPLPPAGKYAGDRYDWQKVKQELNDIPKDASAKEVLNRMYELAAEDYRPVIRYYQNFDPSTIEVERGPNGELRLKELPGQKKVNIAILLDASGSMAGKVDGGVKMKLAKKAVKDFASQMPEGADVSLTVYGHKGSNNKKDQAKSCKGIEEVYSLGSYHEKKFNQALDQFKPTGWTPLAAAMEKTEDRLSSQTEAENIVYVVSDGKETCGGDPVKAAQALHESDMKAVVNIIGFDLDNEGQKALEAVAEAGGGEYSSVDDGASLDQYFAEERSRLYDAWADWANEHYDKASDLSSKKYDQLQKKSNEVYDITQRELRRYEKMTDYLENERGFEFDFLHEKVNKNFRYRIDVIQEWNFDVVDHLQDKVLYNADKIQDEVLEKSDKEQEKLY